MKHSSFKIVILLLAALVAFGAFSVATAQEDTLNLLYWQAPSTLNTYFSTGTKDIEAASLILEPLAVFNPDGVMVPLLATEIPTPDNGGVSDDLTTITWNLRDDIVWSDGTPFTAADVAFTWEYCTHPDSGCAQADAYFDVGNVEALDDHTVLVTFDIPKPFPYRPFVGNAAPVIQQAQFQDCLGAAAQACSEQNFAPNGTGPYVVDEFRANDVITYNANPNYRDADEGKPFFQRVILKGGGDAESAARAVFETGEADYAWNLQVAFPILEAMESAGNGTLDASFSANIERLIITQVNPSSDLPVEERSVYLDGNNPHPFLTHPAVQQALSMAIDRNVIASQLYGPTGLASCNVVNGPPANVSTANDGCLVQDVAGANALLDEAGIVDSDGDGIRELDGVPLKILYQTSTNALRQNTQALVKQDWAAIGVDTELRNIDGSVFFGGDPASPDTHQKAYADVQMFTSSLSGPDPEQLLIRWTCAEMPGPDNSWNRGNDPRHCDPEYDALFAELTETADLAARADLTKQLNDLVIANGAQIPLIFRGGVSAHHNSVAGVWINGWDSELWNVADWTRAG